MQNIGLFPGQGSQTVGMGRAFAARGGQARELFEEADRVLGISLSKLCFEGPIEMLTLTENAQPALLCTGVACHAESGVRLSGAAGHSLGEYAALVTAGVISFADGLQLVRVRGKYMQEAVPQGAGAMVAVMGPSEEEIRAVASKVDNGVAEIANLNCPGQTVVAGDRAGIDRFSELVKEAGGKVIPLNVSAPFHCSLMKPAADRLSKDLDATTFSDPQFPVYANVTAAAIKSGAEARELLKKQVCASVRWTETITNMTAAFPDAQFFEFGPGKVLSKLVKRINKDIAVTEVAEPVSE